MANNRMWLRNKTTGQQVLLAKYYPPTWHCYHNNLSIKLDDMFDNPENFAGNEHDYELVYESQSAVSPETVPE